MFKNYIRNALKPLKQKSFKAKFYKTKLYNDKILQQRILQNQQNIKTTFVQQAQSISSQFSVSRWLKAHDFKYKKEAKQILLTKNYKLDRIDKISSWISSNILWEKTPFADEKRFALDGPDT